MSRGATWNANPNERVQPAEITADASFVVQGVAAPAGARPKHPPPPPTYNRPLRTAKSDKLLALLPLPVEFRLAVFEEGELASCTLDGAGGEVGRVEGFLAASVDEDLAGGIDRH